MVSTDRSLFQGSGWTVMRFGATTQPGGWIRSTLASRLRNTRNSQLVYRHNIQVDKRRGWVWLDHLIRDLRYALRSLRTRPAFALASITTLALGIGANTVIFTGISAVFLKPLPVR